MAVPPSSLCTPVRRRSNRAWWLLALPTLLLVLVVGLFTVRTWVFGFLRGDDFRHFLDRKASAALRADGHFEPLHWEDTEVYGDAFVALGSPASPFSKLTVEQVRARLDLHALWDRVWRVESIQAEKLDATLVGPRAALPDTGAPQDVRIEESSEGHPGFLEGLLPNHVEVGEVRISDFSLSWNSGRVTGTRVNAHPRQGGPENWEIDGTGGRLEEAHFPGVRLTSFNVRSSASEIFLSRALGQSDAGGHLDLSGRQSLQADRTLDLTANVDGLPISDFLPPDWRARLHGHATGMVRITGSSALPDGLHAHGHIELRDGQLEALPMLDQLALFTSADRYRRMPLQKGSADFDWNTGKVSVSNLVLESAGLLRVEGGFLVRGDQIDGTFRVGVARSSLQWIAVIGAQVFNLPEREGYVWTTTHVSGSAQHPSEDLSPRLVAAAQKQVLDKAQQGVGTVLDTASSLLDLLKSH